MSRKRRSEARMGVNMTEERFSYVMTIVRPALSRKLSPYEISKLYAGDIDVSAATLYRWVERGYGGMANIELQRKVGFKPRAQHTEKRMTRHGKKRSYEAFLQLSQDEQDGCCEMDTVIGKRSDRSCILSLYFRPAHFQLYVQLKSRTVDAVKDAFDELERACGRILFRALFSVILTDNGTEFSDPNLIEASEMAALGKRCCIFYCDPRQSQQKGRCEKAHTGLRRKVPKGMSLDAVSEDDIAGVNSDVNSTPRRSLCGMSPVEMLYTAYGTEVGVMLDHFGIAQLGADDIDMRPLDDSNKDVDEGDTELPF
jgi:IS30 family transposase